MLIGSTDSRQNHNFLLGATVLLVDFHNIQKAVDGQQLRCREAGNARICQGHRQIVSLERTSEPTYADLREDSHLSGDLSLEDHADTNTLAVEDSRGKDSLNGMADRVSKVDEVAKTGLALVDGDDVRLDRDRADNDRQQELLCR